MSLPSIDDKICADLLPTFLIENKPFQFNKLHKFLNEKGFKISKPTLSLHLKHLVKKDLVVRTEIENTQYVTYQYNWEKWGKLDKIIKKAREIQKFFEEERESFDSKNSRTQISYVHIVLLLQELLQLKNEMLKILSPDKEFQYNLEIILYSYIWARFKRWLLENFKKNDIEYRKEILHNVEKLIDQYKNVAFRPNNGDKLAS